MTAIATPTSALRLMTLVTAMSGLLTLTVARVVPAPAALTTAVLVGCAMAMSIRLTTEAEQVARRRIAVTALGCASIAAVLTTHGDLTSSVGLVLGLLLCTTSVTHSLVLDSVRDQRVNVAISVSMLVLSAGLAPGFGIAAPVVLTWICALCAFVLAATDAEGANAAHTATVAGTDATSGRARSGGGGRTTAGTVAIAVSVTVLVGLAVALVLPHPSGLSARSAFGKADASTKGADNASTRQADAFLGGGSLNLDTRGALSNQPVAVVTSSPQTLWRATVLESYDGHAWTNAVGVATPLPRNGGGAIAVPADGRSPGQSDASPQDDAVVWLNSSTPVVISPGIVTAVGLRGTAELSQDGDGRLVIFSGQPTTTYAVRSTMVPSIAAAPAPAQGVDAPAAVWRALPPSLPSRVGELAAQVTAGTTNRTEAVRAVEAYLQANYSYDLNSPVPAPGADSVDDFLFNSRSGFCEHFASAEVVMLRSLGIPARLVSGFAARPTSGRGERTLLASDAHAWVEAWIRGTGWTSSDPTAGSTLAKPASHGVAAILHSVTSALTGSTVRKTTLALALLLLAAAALLMPQRIVHRRRRRRHDAANAPARASTAPLFAAFARLETALAASGRPRAQSESVRALAARLDATDDVIGALLAVERASYAGAPPSREEARSAAAALDHETARILTTTV